VIVVSIFMQSLETRDVDADPFGPVFNASPGSENDKKKLLLEAINLYLKDLQDVSLLLATMPVTQVSMEKIFSALKLLKSDLRNKLAEG